MAERQRGPALRRKSGKKGKVGMCVREEREREREAIYSYKKLAFLSAVVVELLFLSRIVLCSVRSSRAVAH